ncbi:MAG: AbiV family abortive infection protein, partial [Nitrosopumilaceae archaeon]
MAKKFDISLEKIPKGILLCLNNSERLCYDSKILAEKNRMPSAVALITIAIEEFGKALWLSDYLNQMACVRHDAAKNIFRVHSDKIKIFYDWLTMQGREPSSQVNKFLKTIEGNDDEQDYKLR